NAEIECRSPNVCTYSYTAPDVCSYSSEGTYHPKVIVESGGTTTGSAGQTCSDGTPYGQCSANKPKYCENGNLVNRCSVCGCPPDYTCQESGKCKPNTCITTQELLTYVVKYIIGSVDFSELRNVLKTWLECFT
ncbi:MAG: hypothetical protein DRP16_01850, partial [Candidatus Aenigmatarchaeota archaeon]